MDRFYFVCGLRQYIDASKGILAGSYGEDNHPCPGIQIGRGAPPLAPLGCINLLSPQFYHCIQDIMIFSLIFASFCSESQSQCQSQSQSQSQSQIPVMIVMSSFGRRDVSTCRPLYSTIASMTS
jgi:hypothetical protein